MSFSSPSSSLNNTSNKRRSARVQKRDIIVAPGFGTQKDLQTLAFSLNLSVPAVQVSFLLFLLLLLANIH